MQETAAMLWIALYLPELSLQIAQRAPDDAPPLVITDGPASRPVVFAANSRARESGIRPGMPLAAARALSGELAALGRTLERESEALHNLAGWACQFTPGVVVQAGEGLVLEAASVLKLHKGLAALLGRLRSEIHELGYRAALGVAPTPAAAWLFAKARHTGRAARTCTDPALLEERMRALPLALFDWPQEVLCALATLGITSIGRCLALPRGGFIRRFGEAPLLELDKALARAPDQRPYFSPPERFGAEIEFGCEVATAPALLFPLKRLLKELEGFLRGRGAGVQAWRIVLAHAGKITTRIALGTTAPERDAERLLALAREKFERTPLAAPALSVRVEADRFFSYETANASWLPDQRQQTESRRHLVDKLVARLGEDRVYGLQSRDDHRPERGFLRVGAAAPPPARAVPHPPAPRPLWLLCAPRALLSEGSAPLCQGRLQLLAGPERIETGWWDGCPAGRDYYVARNPHGETLWIYREHRIADRWYLHGIFA